MFLLITKIKAGAASLELFQARKEEQVEAENSSVAVAQQPTPAANLKTSEKSRSASTALEFRRALWQEPVGDWMPAHRGEGHRKDGVADVTNVVVHSPRPVQAALPAEKCSSGLGLAISPWAQLFPSLSQTLSAPSTCCCLTSSSSP